MKPSNNAKMTMVLAAMAATSAMATPTLVVTDGQYLLPGLNTAVSTKTITENGSTTTETGSALATYGPPPAARFTDGPLVIHSGDTTPLFAGPTSKNAQGSVDYLLFVLSAKQADVGSMGLGSVTFNLQGAGAYAGDGGGSVSFGQANFYSSAADGFPSHIDGIGDSVLNGVQFGNSFHAVAKVSGFDFGSIPQDTLLSLVGVTTPVDVRVDIFGVKNDYTPPSTEVKTIIGYGTKTVYAYVNNKGVIDYTKYRDTYSMARGYSKAFEIEDKTKPIYDVDVYQYSYPAHIVNNTPNSGGIGFQVPDGGSTVALLGLGFFGMAWARRRQTGA